MLSVMLDPRGSTAGVISLGVTRDVTYSVETCSGPVGMLPRGRF
jgi:hypothetical protein